RLRPRHRPRDHADESHRRYGLLLRGQLARSARERDDGREQRTPVPLPYQSARGRPCRDRRSFVPSGARGIVRGGARREWLDPFLVADRRPGASGPHRASGSSRGPLAGRAGAVPAVRRGRAGSRETVPGRRRSSDRRVPRCCLGSIGFELFLRLAGERRLGPRRAEGEVRLRSEVHRPSQRRPVGPDQRRLHWRRAVHTPPNGRRGRRARGDFRRRPDHDHPDVALTAPNGGVFQRPSLSIAWTASAYGPGVGIANFVLQASADAGLTWSPIATLPGSARTYTWDLGAVPNGVAYRIRITAHDDGNPSLTAS